MPRSTVSSEPLSSPSPTPPPRSRTVSASIKPTSAARAAGLESGSELSDLTEDEDGEEGENDGKKSSSEGPSRQRRGGIVPAPMWDWAYKKKESPVFPSRAPGSDDGDEEEGQEGEELDVEDDAPEPVKTEEIGEDEDDAAEDEEEPPDDDPEEDTSIPPLMQAKSESPAPVSAVDAADELLPQRAGTEGEEPDLQEEFLPQAEDEVDEAEPDPEAEGDGDVDATEGGVGAPTETPPDADGDEDIEVEVEAEAEAEPEPEPAPDEEEDEDEADDAMEADTDLQPPQRAEALDILAGIEVKFAILRERLYIDKMEGIAQEEAMVRNDTHPELLHFMATLSQRRERRISLASLRRKYDEDFIRKKRKADEDAVWSWWRVRKEDLRDFMVAEANGKRRRLEREKRSLESRTGVRRSDTPAEVHMPPQQTIKQIMRQHQRPTSSAIFPMHASLPTLPTLTESEISQDLDVLVNPRRQKLPYNHPNSYHLHSHNHVPHHPHNQDIYTSNNTGVGGEYGVIDGSQYAGMPPPTIHNASTSSQHRHHVSHSAPLAGSRSFPSTTGSHLHDGPSNYSLPPAASSTTQSSRNYTPTYPSTSSSHMYDGPSNYAMPPATSSSSQQPRNYPSAPQYVQQMPPNQMHITPAPVIPRKRSLSPNRIGSSHAGTQANGWEDGGYRRSKVPRVGNADGVDAIEDWGGPLTQQPVRRGQPPSQRRIHRPTPDQYPPYDAHGDGLGLRDRPQSNTPSRVPVSVE